MKQLRGRPRLAKALKDVGATLKRGGKHLVYELPNGNTFTTSSTASDCNAEHSDIRHLMIAAGFRGLR